MHNNQEVNLPFTLGYMKFKSQFYGLGKKSQARNNGFIFNEKVKLTTKIDSRQSNINICYYLGFRTPIWRREVFRILSQTPEYVKNFCNDMNYPFHFACRRWILYDQSPYKMFVNLRFLV